MTEFDWRQLDKLANVMLPPRLQSKMGAEDLAQEARLRILESDPQFAGRTPEETVGYLRRTVRSVVVDVRRRHSCGRRQSGFDVALVIDPRADQTSTSGKAMRNERLIRLYEALESLPIDQRTAIQLHNLGGLSLNETGQQMGRTWTSVAGLVRRGLANLRFALAERET